MFTIAFVDRVRLNYSSCTIASIVLYAFFVSFLTEYSSKLWPHVIYFVICEVFKLFIIQKFYSLDLSSNFEGSRRRRANKVNDSLKFAALMLLTVCIFAFICIVLGGECLNLIRVLHGLRQDFISIIVLCSARVRSLRGDLHVVSTFDESHSVSGVDFCRCLGHGLSAHHRVVWARKYRESVISEAVEAQRYSSHLRSLCRFDSISTRLGSSLADLSSAEYGRCHNWILVRLLLLLSGDDDKI